MALINHKHLLRALILTSIAFSLFEPFFAQPAQADIAPPWEGPAGGAVRPYEYQNTNVQMMYERVELEMQIRDDNWTQIVVVAKFQMRNQGTTAESMQVIFPFTDATICFARGDYYYQIDEQTFTVKIDGANATVKPITTPNPLSEELKTDCPPITWGAFSAAFPAGQDVIIEVAYTMMPLGFGAWQSFYYLLETGAGWYGPINHAEVVLTLPYPVSKENISAWPAQYKLRGNEIYRFWDNLEPTARNNLRVSLANPVIWQDILYYRAVVQRHPDDIASWEKLASAYQDLATFHYWEIEDWAYARLCIETYQQAIAHHRDSADLRVGLARMIFLMSLNGNGDRIRLEYPSVQLAVHQLNVALKLDPHNSEAKDLLAEIKERVKTNR